jgi:hypothetical protein
MHRRTHRRISVALSVAVYACLPCVGAVGTATPRQSLDAANPVVGQLFAWSEVVRHWNRHDDPGARALVAGALMDCASHSTPSATWFPLGHDDIGGNTHCRSGNPASCTREALRQYAEALKANPALDEARLRSLYLRDARAPEEFKEAAQISQGSSNADVRYIARLMLGQWELTAGHTEAARAWFTAARTLNEHGIAPLIGLAAVDSPASVNDLRVAITAPTHEDPWYRFPCIVLTPQVQAEVLRRMTERAAARGVS